MKEKIHEKEFITKDELWLWQVPNFNFDIDEDKMLKIALKRGFVEKTDKKDLYKVNHNYNK
tara:strand:- start:322 stop:504 length:183 start_codon:yes stop_codon:yes gene_type:complete